MKYIKKFENKDNKDNIQGLKEIFNLVLPDPEVFKIPYSYRNTGFDYNIYVVSGVRCESDDHKFLQELYHNHEILNDIYNLEFFNITLSKTKTYATIVLYDYLLDPNSKNRSKFENKNFLSEIKDYELPLPSNIKARLKPSMLQRNYIYYLSKVINYSDGSVSNLSLFDWIYQPEVIKQYEDINVPIKVGDTILGGRFKNKKIVVKKIGKNKKGDITINDKPLLKYRIIKESISQEDINNGLAYLIDDGFKIINDSNNLNGIIQIFKQKEFKEHNNMDNLIELNWSDIENDMLPFIEVNKNLIKDIILTYSTFTTYSGTSEIKTYDRETFSVDQILEDKDFGKILKINIRLR